MKNILVPTDFSKESDYALDFAYQMAEKMGARLDLLHIVKHPKDVLLNATGDIDMEDPEKNEFIQTLVTEARKKLEQQKKKYPVIINHRVEIGDPSEVLAQNAARIKYQFIVLGTQGDQPGHKAKHVVDMVRSSRCPAITVKSPVKLSSLERILFASNLLEEEDRVLRALQELKGVLGLPIFTVKVLTANDLPPTSEDKQLMLNFTERYQLDPSRTDFTNAPTEAEGIMHYARQHPGCLIALGTHGRSGLAHYISGSVAEELATHASAPVWTCFLG